MRTRTLLPPAYSLQAAAWTCWLPAARTIRTIPAGYIGWLHLQIRGMPGAFSPPYSYSAALVLRCAVSGDKRALGGGTKRCL